MRDREERSLRNKRFSTSRTSTSVDNLQLLQIAQPSLSCVKGMQSKREFSGTLGNDSNYLKWIPILSNMDDNSAIKWIKNTSIASPHRFINSPRELEHAHCHTHTHTHKHTHTHTSTSTSTHWHKLTRTHTHTHTRYTPHLRADLFFLCLHQTKLSRGSTVTAKGSGRREILDDDYCFYYLKQQFCTLDWGSM